MTTDALYPGWAAALDQVLQEVDPAGKVTEFVLTGRHADALNGLAGPRPWAAARSRWSDAASRTALAALYQGFGKVDAAVLRRWGRVLDALRGGYVWGSTFGVTVNSYWPGLMLEQAAGVSSGPMPFTFADLARIAAEDGTSAEDLVRAALRCAPSGSYAYFWRLPGVADAVAAHRDVAATALTSGDVDRRVTAAAALSALDDAALRVLAEPIAESATTTSAQVRAAARPLLERTDAAAVDPLRALASSGRPEQRGHALELLAARADQRAWAIEIASADRAASVRSLVAGWEAADVPPDADGYRLPELPLLPSWALPADDAKQVANQVVEAVWQGIDAHNRSTRTHYSNGLHDGIPDPPREALARLLACHDPVRADAEIAGIPAYGYRVDPVTNVIRQHGYTAATAIQVMAVVGWFDTRRRGGSWSWAEVIDEVHARTGGPDLLTLQRMLDATGADGRALVWSSYSSAWGARIGRDWPDDDVWPFVAYNLDWLLDEPASHQAVHPDEHALCAAVATLPVPPTRLVDRLYAMAVGPRKTDRLPAQAALHRDPQRTARVAAVLKNRKSDVRLTAAQWLTRIADPAALPALQEAWREEKEDVVRSAILDALIALGEDAGIYLDPATTAAAEEFVARGLPAELAWLRWEAVPELSWASSGEAVPQSVVQWLCGTAVKAKSARPNAMLLHYAALLEAAARERLAAHLLAVWLEEDVRPVSPAGSAYASRGLLAVVAACGGRDVVPPAERYLRKWFGYRTPQGKALIAMLAWVDHPSATQLVFSIGTRFRTKGFQEEAMRQAGLLAERKGWTVDELADRTIPTAGFGDNGVIELPYGPRTFTVRIRPDLIAELRDPAGKVLKSLPTPRQSDDADQAKESKKAFSAAKKELKSIAATQAQRLYEAMCTQRSWTAEDWERYLLRHPIVGRAVRRLVWVASAGDGAPVTFRPLDDGTLTDADDNDVKLPEGARIRVAHDSVLSPDEIEQWTAHLADYEVTPLFGQLGRGMHALTPDLRSRRELTDFTGHMLESFALRGRATRLGYTRGPVVDNGFFYSYEKIFPSLGITAVVTFTGGNMPEANCPVALKELAFQREGRGRWGQLTLGEVPAVLVSECWNDMRLLAAEGTGFDPDWEKKAEY